MMFLMNFKNKKNMVSYTERLLVILFIFSTILFIHGDSSVNMIPFDSLNLPHLHNYVIGKDVKVISLSPDQSLFNLTLSSTDALLVSMHGLQSGSHYELRASYPAFKPTRFSFDLVKPLRKPSIETPERHHHRHILNAEKIMWSIDPSWQDDQLDEFKVILTIAQEAPSVSFQLDKHHVTFNLSLESLWFGIPSSTLPMIFFGLLLVFFCVCCVFFRSRFCYSPPPLFDSRIKKKIS
mmetsp:Transcript_12099/g.18012  ORF Transcript_12099/g.18012 Transcript_12099/m.18012 type:complete len:237 (+) Transcript_12099:14-724(+)